MDSETLTFVVKAVATVALGTLIPFKIAQVWAQKEYKYLCNNPKTECDVDAHVNPEKNPVSALKVVAMYKAQLGNRKASHEAIPLECFPSPFIEGLYVTRRKGGKAKSTGGPPVADKDLTSLEDFLKTASTGGKKKPIVVATIRMGFGHHRLAYSTVSWALGLGHPCIFHDCLNIESEEAGLLVNTDDLYSKVSRLASEVGGPIEKALGTLLLQGDADALRVANLTASQLQPLLLAYPKDTPIITTHQLVALTAVAAGFTNVVNLVVDNHAQWFLTVPKTKNMMQGPVNYQTFLRMGITPKEVVLAGHWCGKDMVDNIPRDCQARIKRAQSGFDNNTKDSFKARRLVVPVGGAGAQRKYITNLLRNVAELVTQGKVQLFLNAGDHKHMKESFEQTLKELKLDYDTVDSMKGVEQFQKDLLVATNEPKKAVTLFAYEEYVPAVATTDILCRVADVLACKPSEMAFYPIPKLMLRRVGEHEAFSATRASELGDGTVEAREVSDARDFIDLFLASPDLLVQMNESIMRNNTIGTYSGCKVAIETVLEMADGKK